MDDLGTNSAPAPLALRLLGLLALCVLAPLLLLAWLRRFAPGARPRRRVQLELSELDAMPLPAPLLRDVTFTEPERKAV